MSMLSLVVCPCCGMKLAWYGATELTTEEAQKLGYRSILWMTEEWIAVDSAGRRVG